MGLNPKGFQALEAQAEVVPVSGRGRLLVEFGEQRLEVAEAADGAVPGVIAPGDVFAGAAEQESLLDALQRKATLEPVPGQDFIGGRESALDARPGLEQFLESGKERLGRVVRREGF